MRMTIHLVPAEDAGWMLPLFEPTIARWSRRRLEQLGMEPKARQKALRIIERALDLEGPLTRPELAERIVSGGVQLDSSTRLHITLLSVTSGIACLGPDRGRSTCLVRREDWLGKRPRPDRERGLAELARRYLGAFGPASERDFAYWSGLPLRELRKGLSGISAELDQSRLGGETLLALRKPRRRVPPVGQVRMLGAFDTYMLGYKERGFAVRPEDEALVKEGGGGWIRPVIVQDGRLIGGWRVTRKGGKMQIKLIPLQPFSSVTRRAIDVEVADIGRFEDRRVSVEG
jgi:Winged helix DNA-binding domain